MTRRNDDLVDEPGDYLTLAVRALVHIQRVVPANTPVAYRCKTSLASLGFLETELRRAGMIPPHTRGQL